MGSPDYPGDENHTFQPPPGHAMPMHGQLHSDEDAADSDNNDLPPTDPMDPYQSAGYQPLNAEPMAADDDSSSDDDDSVAVAADYTNVNKDEAEDEDTTIPEPPETTVEREVLQEIWNAPRPAELDIELDKTKTDQILSVMSTISLGLSAVKPPDWATNVPESKWIEQLLLEVRNKNKAVPPPPPTNQ